MSDLEKSKGDPYFKFSKYESFGKKQGGPLYIFCLTVSKIVRVPFVFYKKKRLLSLNSLVRKVKMSLNTPPEKIKKVVSRGSI